MDWQAVQFDWNQARAFLVTAREGSYTAAARALKTTQPTIGRQVSALEEALGVTLFERVGRGLALTSAGLELADHVAAMGEAALAVSMAAAGQSGALEGLVRVTASEAITAHLLPPAVATLRRDHPGIELELLASNAIRDLRRREADIAVRNARPTDPALVAKKIGTSMAYLYGTSDYLERVGTPSSVEDLARCEIFAFDDSDTMVDGFRSMGVAVDRSSFPVIASNHLVQWELAKRGLGLCAMMSEVGDNEPLVRRVLDEVVAFPIPIWVTCHSEIRTSRRMRVVFDALVDALAGFQPGETLSP